MRVKESSGLNLPAYSLENNFEFDFSSARTNLFFLLGLFSVVTTGIGIPFTREATLFILEENNLVEILTFAAFLIGGAAGLKLCYESSKSRENPLFTGFFMFFSISLIFIGMEEISWGQQFFGFATPESFREINDQGETTLHNIKGMSGNSEYLRLVFGIGGAIGVFLSRTKIFGKLAAPVFLLPWFALIIAHSVVDVFNDIVPIHKNFDALISELAELVEMLIAFSALIYVYFKLKTFQSET